MPVPSTVSDLDAVAANNSPSGSEPIGTNLDDYLRSHAAIIKQVNNAKADLASPTFTGTVTTANLTASGDVTMSGSGKRITGDFSNATVANRVMFQTSTANGNSLVGAIPNGTGTTTFLSAHNASTPDNSAAIRMGIDGSVSYFDSTKFGTGTYLPMTFYTGGSERMRIDTSGNVGIGAGFTPSYKLDVRQSGTATLNLINTSRTGNDDATNFVQVSSFDGTYWGRVQLNAASYKFQTYNSDRLVIDSNGVVTAVSPTGGLGYGSGSGGTVTQATSRTTAVTLNKPTGAITMFSAAGATSWNLFRVSNSLVSASDMVVLSIRVGAINFYTLQVVNVQAGSFDISFLASGTATDAPVINFAIIKGATA